MTLEIVRFSESIYYILNELRTDTDRDFYQQIYGSKVSNNRITSSTEYGIWLWSRGGNGHKAAMEAHRFQTLIDFEKQNQRLVARDYDVMGEKFLNSIYLPFVGNLGDHCVNCWNSAQKEGDVEKQLQLVNQQWIAESLFGGQIYVNTKRILEDLPQEPALVVSTQAMCTKAILTAIQVINFEKDWNIKLNLIMTDLPTEKAIHFFNSLQIIGKDEDLSKLIVVYAARPLTREKTPEAEKAFWQKYCGAIQVKTDAIYPIRQPFLNTEDLGNKLSKETVDVRLKINPGDKKEMFEQGSDLKMSKTFTDTTVTFHIKNTDKVGFLMLGSQPTHEAVLGWISKMTEFARDAELENKQINYYFFVFCGAPSHPTDTTNRNDLLKAVLEKITDLRKEDQLPSLLSIIPFTYQGAEELALLMGRSDFTLTRAGGLTSMEILHLLDPKNSIPHPEDRLTLINSEKIGSMNEDSIYSKEELMESLLEHGIPLWEAGNARYLMETVGAEIVHPDHFTGSIRKKFFNLNQ